MSILFGKMSSNVIKMKLIPLVYLAFVTSCLAAPAAKVAPEATPAGALPKFSWQGNVLLIDFGGGNTDRADMHEELDDEDVETDAEDEKDDTCFLVGKLETGWAEIRVTGCAGDDSFDVRLFTLYLYIYIHTHSVGLHT